MQLSKYQYGSGSSSICKRSHSLACKQVVVVDDDDGIAGDVAMVDLGEGCCDKDATPLTIWGKVVPNPQAVPMRESINIGILCIMATAAYEN